MHSHQSHTSLLLNLNLPLPGNKLIQIVVPPTGLPPANIALDLNLPRLYLPEHLLERLIINSHRHHIIIQLLPQRPPIPNVQAIPHKKYGWAVDAIGQSIDFAFCQLVLD